MPGERDPRLQSIGADATTNEEQFAAALRAAGDRQEPAVVFRGNRMVGVLRAEVDTGEENRAAFIAATIDAAVASGDSVVVGIGPEYIGTFIPMDVTEAVRRQLAADPVLDARLQADMQLPSK